MQRNTRHIERLAIFLGLLLGGAGCASVGEPGVTPHKTAVQMSDEGVALRLARASRTAGDLASAINLYRAYVDQQPDKYAVKVELGDALLEAGSLDEAIGVFESVDKASSARLGALVGLSQIYLRLNDPATALRYADEAEAAFPGDRRMLNQRGVTLDSLGRHGEAQNCYRGILADAPRDVSARNNLALSLAFSGAYDEAIAILTPMARSSDASPQLRQNLALVYGLQGDIEKAASLSRLDLSNEKVESNLQFFEHARRGQPLCESCDGMGEDVSSAPAALQPASDIKSESTPRLRG